MKKFIKFYAAYFLAFNAVCVIFPGFGRRVTEMHLRNFARLGVKLGL